MRNRSEGGAAQTIGMLGFVAPLRHPASSQSYAAVLRNLRLTLATLTRQLDPDWRAVIVGNQAPAWPMPDRVEFVEVDLDPPFEYPENPSTQSIVTLDKGRKIAIGIARLRHLGASHVMPFDADDLLHYGLSALVNSDPTSAGWFADSGYIHVENTRLLWFVPSDFDQRNGSSHIVRTDLVPLSRELGQPATVDELASVVDEQVLSGLLGRHRAWRQWASDLQHPLQAAPMPMAIWVVGTGQNQSGVLYQRGPRVPIDAAVTAAFGLVRPTLMADFAHRPRLEFVRMARRIRRRDS